jgi:hypothetical protein
MSLPKLVPDNGPPITPTEDGVGFLKVATAAPDFESTPLEGIPDGFMGPTIVKKDFILKSVDCAPGFTTFFVVTPTAAVAYYTTTSAGGDLGDGWVFTPSYFPDAADVFPGILNTTQVASSTASIVAQGRLMSLAAEMVCTTNAFNQYGTVSAIKSPLAFEIAPNLPAAVGNVELPVVVGAACMESNLLHDTAYMAPVKDGAYATSFNREEEFMFHPVRDNININSAITGNLSTQLVPPKYDVVTFQGAATVWDNGYDSIIFRVTVPPAVPNQSFVLKVWKTFEYQPVFNSLLSTMSHLSPPADPATMRLYRDLGRQLPTAVASKDNPDFWNTVLGLVDQASDVLSAVPGPVGLAAKGVHAVSSIVSKTRSNRRAKTKDPATSRRKPKPKPKQRNRRKR